MVNTRTASGSHSAYRTRPKSRHARTENRSAGAGCSECADTGTPAPTRETAQAHAVARAVPEQALEVGEVGRRGDDQDVPDARQHESAKRIVDHGLVVDRQQLLGGHERERVQAGAGTAGKDDAFHIFRPLQSKIVINRAVSKSLIFY